MTGGCLVAACMLTAISLGSPSVCRSEGGPPTNPGSCANPFSEAQFISYYKGFADFPANALEWKWDFWRSTRSARRDILVPGVY
jgi:hypothetical protein